MFPNRECPRSWNEERGHVPHFRLLRVWYPMVHEMIRFMSAVWYPMVEVQYKECILLRLFSLVTTMISLYCRHNFPSQIMENILIDGRHFSKRTIMILSTGVREQQLKMAEV